MTIHKQLEKQGNWLFRWRSYLPLLILPILLAALNESESLERVLGVSNLFWEIFCLLLSFVGLAIRCLTIGYVPKGTSGRNTKRQIAEVLNTTGMYSIVRHPLYLGNFIIFLGIVLFVQVWWFVLISVLAFWLYYERIIFAEEQFLQEKYGVLFLKWAEKTPLFLPKFRNWQKPALPFSSTNVLKREYTAFFLITTYFSVIDFLADIFAEGKLELELGWGVLFVIGLITYLTLGTLKTKTKILDVEGR
jgi:protein-S-isoprenylcysteine O-methyltransferase Ste14